jgi:hypothetical protein
LFGSTRLTCLTGIKLTKMIVIKDFFGKASRWTNTAIDAIGLDLA